MADTPLTLKQKQDLEKVLPMWKIIATQFFEHRMAVIGLFVICTFILIALLAPVIEMVTGLNPERQNPLNRYKPVMTVAELPQDQREDRIMALENANPDTVAALRTEVISRGFVTPAREEDALYDLAFQDPKEAIKKLKEIDSPLAKEMITQMSDFQTTHILGTDELGRDVFIRLVYGARVSMGVGIMVAIASALIGLLIGSLAGFYGGVIDTVLMRFTDSLLSLPVVPVLIVLAAIDLNKIPLFSQFVGSQNESIFKLFFVLLIFSWMTTALLVRGSILSLREREFILAAKTLGAKDSTIILRHMFPNVIAPLLVSVTLGVGESILFEAVLSFLGLGIQPPTPSWGNMLFNAQELISEAPLLAFTPGFLILLVTISFNYLGDGLQDAIDPKAIRR